MANKILHKRSSVEGKVPQQAQLDLGEIAVNTTDEALYIKNTAGNIIKFASDVYTRSEVDALLQALEVRISALESNS